MPQNGSPSTELVAALRTLRASRSRLVAAPRDTVWETLSAFDQIGRWAKQVDRAAYTTSVTQGLGTARRVQAGLITLVETITSWDPPRQLAYSIAGAPPVVRHVTNSWQLEAVAGGTQVTLTTTIEPRATVIGRIAAVIFCWVMTMTSERLLADLAEYHSPTTISGTPHTKPKASIQRPARNP